MLARLQDRKGWSSVSARAEGNILVVDAARLIRGVVAESLRLAGFRVETARDAQAALWKLAHESFDVLIVDPGMPGFGRLGSMRTLESLETRPEVIAMTSSGQDRRRVAQTLRRGAGEVLTKPPASPDQVVVSVQRAIDRKRLRDDNNRMLRELQQLSQVDSLTGVNNRRAFDQALRLEATRARSYDQPLSLVLLDPDRMGEIDQAFGSAVADGVVAGLASRLSSMTRGGDGLYRHADARFALLLPQTSLGAAAQLAARIVACLATTPFRSDGEVVDLTASAGVAFAQGSDASGLHLMTCADLALMTAQQGGGDQVALHPRRSRPGSRCA